MHDRDEQIAFDNQRDEKMKAVGFAVIRLDERLVRERPQEACAWIRMAGERVLQGLSPFPEMVEWP